MKSKLIITTILFFFLIQKLTFSANQSFATIQDSLSYEKNIRLSKSAMYSNPDSFLLYVANAMLTAKKMNSREKQGFVFSVLGDFSFYKEKYSIAIENYYQALHLAELSNYTSLKITTLINISNIYSLHEKPNEALENLIEALKLTEKYKSVENLAIIYSYLSEVYIKLNQYENALKYAEKSSYIFIANKDPRLAIAYDNIGTAYFHTYNFDKALVYFRKSLYIAKTQKNDDLNTDLYLKLAKLFLEKNRTDSAFIYAIKAENLSVVNNDLEFQTQTFLTLYTLYKNSKNSLKALEYHEKYLNAYNNQHKESQIAQIEKNVFIYNTNKRIKEDSLKQRVINLQKDHKIKENQNQIKQDKLFKIGLFSLIILAIGFSIFAYNRYKVISYQHRLIEIKNSQTEAQKEIITQKNNEVKDSLNYAKRIQEGLLASDKLLSRNLKKHFIYFKPKDIVSGDFYWSTEYQNNFYLAICDSTGHGVPGAFMSLLNIALLSEAIKEKQIKEPHLIFNEVRDRLIEIISADGHKDGFDGILIRLEKLTNGSIKVQYAAANNEPVLVRNNQLIKLDADRMPVSKSDFLKSFTLHSIDILEGDMLYLYTDGFADQFGGSQQKKFKRKHLNELLAKNSAFDMAKQSLFIDKSFNEWKQNEEQVDDVCVFGIQF